MRSATIRILVHLLQHGPKTIPRLVEELVLTHQAVRNSLKTLLAMDLVKMQGSERRWNTGSAAYLYRHTITGIGGSPLREEAPCRSSVTVN